MNATFPWQRLLPESIPFSRLWNIFSRIWFYFSLSSKHHFALLFQPYWEETPALHSKHKNQNNNKKQAKQWHKRLLYIYFFLIEQKILEYCQVLLVSVWQISTWHNNFLSPYFPSCYFIVCHGNRKHLNKPTGNENQIFTWEHGLALAIWSFSLKASEFRDDSREGNAFCLGMRAGSPLYNGSCFGEVGAALFL